MKRFRIVFAAAMLVAAAVPMRAQERVTVPFDNNTMPRKLVVDTMMGNVTVTGYDGQEVVVEVSGEAARQVARQRNNREDIPEGFTRIGPSRAGLDVTEENNTVRIRNGGFPASGNYNIQVPRETSVSVKTLTGKEVRISNVSGEIEVENMNGEVTIENVSGSVVAHSMNGKIVASLNSVMPDKPMSFSTMNGTIDVTLPADIKANVKMKSQNGEMYSDFDIKLDNAAKGQPQVEDNRANGGRYRVRTDNSTAGTINGGGPEIQFTTFNGNILIRKKK